MNLQYTLKSARRLAISGQRISLLSHAITRVLALVAFLFYGQAQAVGSDLDIREIAESVFMHQGVHEDMSEANLGNIANIGFIVGEKSVLVIDPGGSAAVGQSLRKAISVVTDLPVSHVIYTHAHPDHIFGATAFADGAEIVAHKNFQIAFAQRELFYRTGMRFLFRNADGAINSDALPAPTIVVDDIHSIDLGGRTVEVRAHSIAHTNNDLSIYDAQTKLLWASDLVFSERTPALDGSLPGWIAVLAELKALEPAVVVPGHGPAGAWEAVVGPQRGYLEKLLMGMRQFIKAGGRLSEAIEETQSAIGAGEQWQLFDLHHPTNVTKAFTELEWE